MENTKQCSTCKTIKNVSEFNKDKATIDGLHSLCKKCRKEISIQYEENNKEKIAKRKKTYNQIHKKEIAEYCKIYRAKNKKKFRLNGIKRAMIQRCEDVNYKGYKNYGGRGITVCEEWHDVKIFKKWALQNGYKNNLTIDRIDNNKGYYPKNCQWITQHEQILKQDRNKDRTKEDLYIYARKTGTFRVEVITGTAKKRILRVRKTFPTKEEAIMFRDHFLKTGEQLEFKSDYVPILSKKKKEYLRTKKRKEMLEKYLLTIN